MIAEALPAFNEINRFSVRRFFYYAGAACGYPGLNPLNLS